MGGLLSDQERCILALIRSANGSANDIAIYNLRVHGYLPKSPINGLVSVKEQLAPLWLSRYNQNTTSSKQDISKDNKDSSGYDEETTIFVNNLVLDISTLDRLISNSFVPLSTIDTGAANAGAESKQLSLEQWPSIWDKLHVIKGDLQTINVDEDGKGEISLVIDTINAMRGPTVPSQFDEKWRKLNSTLRSALDS